MRKEPVLGLAGLILAGVLGCETNRPYCSRCMTASNHYGQAETAYRPKTVVTMRADEVPENPTPAQTCPAIQLVGASSTTAALASGQATGSGQTVTVTIPAMKIVVPVNAAVAAPPATAKEASAVTELPPNVGSMVQTSGTASMSSSSANSKSNEATPQAVASTEKKDTTNPPSMSSGAPPLPEPVHESKSKSKSAAINSEPVRLPRLSALPPEPPPDIPVHRSSSPTTSRLTDVPPPPPIPKPQPTSGPVLPSEEAAPQ
jgi:hypothetical protein